MIANSFTNKECKKVSSKSNKSFLVYKRKLSTKPTKLSNRINNYVRPKFKKYKIKLNKTDAQISVEKMIRESV